MSILDQIKTTFGSTVNTVQKKTNSSISVYKLQSQIKSMEQQKDALIKAIGAKVYEAVTAGAEPDIKELIQSVADIDATVSDLRGEIDKLNEVRRCVNCGRTLTQDQLFCPQCGTKNELPEAEPVKEQELCPECGAERAEGALFCSVCGHSFAEAPKADPAE